MAMTVCPECEGKVSDKALACPSCGYPLGQQKGGSAWPDVLGGMAGTYISAQALVTIIVGSIMFTTFAAIVIAAVLS
ncbi:hypothetical protein J2T08_006092 [Neorhizobium galegae]|uniref:hypothetical protein n=1 Tax=Neorhizobium galegae TaxID=399 RepID=UPI001AE32667|nr:hypothetical protein [Neorhizobium galegae]MBP2562386.1 hypothetical protein [Neorhizobium galegae]MDQ0138147.1 hypothetical protein [Neorhizobium galegae]